MLKISRRDVSPAQAVLRVVRGVVASSFPGVGSGLTCLGFSFSLAGQAPVPFTAAGLLVRDVVVLVVLLSA
ncbi:hypothetical protein [Micromonospora sp. DPT]|uniref:hypothetical protein n=1 Tax=Micromonospora sp. DPT TaxID=3142975 RepID=UPI00320A51B5